MSNDNRKEKVIGSYYYKMDKPIGQGQFSNVYEGFHEQSRIHVAIKQIDKKQMNSFYVTLLKNEVEILKQVDHPNILKLYDFYETPNNFYIVTEFCKTDTLEIIKKRKVLTEEKAKLILFQVTDALIYLHEKKGIIHRDIKPSNILIHEDRVKLADFGFAQSETNQSKQKELQQFQIGSPLYMAPETLLNNKYSRASDVWALGIIFYEFLSGTVPFFSMDYDELRTMMKRFVIERQLAMPSQFTSGSSSIIKKLLEADPNKRIKLYPLRPLLMTIPVKKIAMKLDQTFLSSGQSERDTSSNQLGKQKDEQYALEYILKLRRFTDRCRDVKVIDQAKLCSYLIYNIYGENTELLNQLQSDLKDSNISFRLAPFQQIQPFLDDEDLKKLVINTIKKYSRNSL